jgi:hypothetical protein
LYPHTPPLAEQSTQPPPLQAALRPADCLCEFCAEDVSFLGISGVCCLVGLGTLRARETPRLILGVCGGSLVIRDAPRHCVCGILKDELCGILTIVCGAILTAGTEICGTTRGTGTATRGMVKEGMRM